MHTLTFSLQLDDGQIITAHVEAESCLEDAAVRYSGPVARLPFAPVRASGIELRAYLQSFARELNARLHERVQEDTIPGEPEETQTSA